MMNIQPSELKSRAKNAAIIILLQAIFLMAFSGKSGWQAIVQLDVLVAFAIGIAAGVRMAIKKPSDQ